MQTTVTSRGQTVIPAELRRRYHIQEGDLLVWLDDGQSIRVVPVAARPLQSLKGRGRGQGLGSRLLQERRREP